VGSKDPCCIIGTNVLQTGININEITHMINARGLKGEIPTIQGLGRGVRKADGKMELFFYDFYDEVPYLQDHSEERISHYKELKFNVTYEKNIKRDNS
jgi:superfamily II DNA or RNA helicase